MSRRASAMAMAGPDGIIPNASKYEGRERRKTAYEDLPPGSYKLSGGCARNSTFFKAITSAERVMYETLTNEEIAERLIGQWTTEGVVGALFGSISYSALTAPLACGDGSTDCIHNMLFANFMTLASMLVSQPPLPPPHDRTSDTDTR
jgi:hypothetical protein